MSVTEGGPMSRKQGATSGRRGRDAEHGGARRMRQLQRKIASLEAENHRLSQENASKDRRIAKLRAEIARLRAALTAAERAGKRQAAPFSKGSPKANPLRPGRKPGRRYGRKAHQTRPPSIDQSYDAKLPERCPKCHGRVKRQRVQRQYQVELPSEPIYREFRVEIGQCTKCGARIQGRHPLQASDALGAAGVHAGRHLQATIAWLNKRAGLSYGKIVSLLREAFGIALSRGGAASVVLRVGRKCQASVSEIEAAIGNSSSIVGDETGWKVGGKKAWLHTIVGDDGTCFRIDDRRSVKVQANVIGVEYSGTVIHDGYSSYNCRLPNAAHQQCVSHLMRRLQRILLTTRGAARRFPQQVLNLFQFALDLRNEYRQGKRTLDELASYYLGLWIELERLLAVKRHSQANRRLAKHLARHIREWFWFLLDPSIDATNYRAEQALRAGVVNRKVWGGNRTKRGATAQTQIMTVIETARRKKLNAISVLEGILTGKPPPLVSP